MSEYTPTTDDVREFYQGQLVKGDDDVYMFADEEKSNAEFDRWLAGVKADAWEEGTLYAAVECNAIDDERQPWLAVGENPYREAVE
jgi:hypothetical protein